MLDEDIAQAREHLRWTRVPNWSGCTNPRCQDPACKGIKFLKSISRLFYDMAAWGRLMVACRKPFTTRARAGETTYTWLFIEGPFHKEWIDYIPEPKESREAA